MVLTPKFLLHFLRRSRQKTMVDIFWLGAGSRNYPDISPTVWKVKHKVGLAERRCSSSIANERRQDFSERTAK